MKKENNLLYFPKWIDVIIILNDKNINMYKICRDNNITYAHLLKIIKIFKKFEMITFKKIKSSKIIILTEKGNKLKNICLRLKSEYYNIIK